jgi:hypothetical protein
LTSTLAEDRALRLAWEPVPIVAGTGLPNAIRSGWIFLLRRGTVTGAERHPNSIQRVMSWRGAADLQTWDGGAWRSHELTSDRRKPQADRWLTIPVNVWHRPVISRASDWLVVSFHTATADGLIEERAVDDERPDGGIAAREVYAGRQAR